MIDVYAIEGTLKDPRALATDLAQTMMVVLQAPEIPLLRRTLRSSCMNFRPDCSPMWMAKAGSAGSADYVRADANRTGAAVQRGYGVDAAMVRARRLQRRHRWPGTRVRPRAHEAPRLGTPPGATKCALKREHF